MSYKLKNFKKYCVALILLINTSCRFTQKEIPKEEVVSENQEVIYIYMPQRLIDQLKEEQPNFEDSDQTLNLIDEPIKDRTGEKLGTALAVGVLIPALAAALTVAGIRFKNARVVAREMSEMSSQIPSAPPALLVTNTEELNQLNKVLPEVWDLADEIEVPQPASHYTKPPNPTDLMADDQAFKTLYPKATSASKPPQKLEKFKIYIRNTFQKKSTTH